MNNENETGDFARWVRAARQSVDRASFSGIEHHTAEPQHKWSNALWFAACMLVSAGIGALAAGWGAA